MEISFWFLLWGYGDSIIELKTFYNYNLGCGNDKKKGYINLDKDELDLEKDFTLFNPDRVYLRSVLEHIINPDLALKRIADSKPNEIIINTPTFSPIIQHKLNMLGSNSFNYLMIYHNFKKIKVKRKFNLKSFLSHLFMFIECMLFDRIEITFKKGDEKQ